MRHKRKTTTIMAQETLNGLLQYVLTTLPLEDKVWFTQQMEQDIRRLQAEQDEIELIDQAVDMSLEDVAAGKVVPDLPLISGGGDGDGDGGSLDWRSSWKRNNEW